jgi:hypothetical protein
MTTLRSVVARLASLVRCAGIAYIAVQVAIWHSYYAAVPWRLAGPVAASVWAAAVTVYLRRGWPAPLFACLDSAVYVAFALSCQGCVPPSLRGHAYSWLVIAMSGQLLVPAWYAPVAVSVPLALAAPAAYWAGAVQATGAVSRTTTVATILLAMVAGVHIYGRRALSGRAAEADAALAEADRAASEQYVVLSRNVERREHERLLHDRTSRPARYERRSKRSRRAETGFPPASPTSSPPMTPPTSQLSAIRKSALSSSTRPECQ